LNNIIINPRGWWTGLNDKSTEGVWVYPEAFNNPVNLKVM